MKLQQVMSHVRRAIDDYHMIEEGDCIAVGISGGKDSLALLYALSGLRRYYPKHFSIYAVTVDLGFQNLNLDKIVSLCKELNVPYKVIQTNIGEIVFRDRKEDNPCALCSKMRKGALNNAMKELGCNKVAYAHHKDDMIETLFLSMIFEGRLNVFPPKTFLDRTRLTVIRPLMYVSESEIRGFLNKYSLPVVENPCPVDGATKRQYVKDLIRQMNLDYPGVKKRLFHAITEGNLPGWKDEIQ